MRVCVRVCVCVCVCERERERERDAIANQKQRAACCEECARSRFAGAVNLAARMNSTVGMGTNTNSAAGGIALALSEVAVAAWVVAAAVGGVKEPICERCARERCSASNAYANSAQCTSTSARWRAPPRHTHSKRHVSRRPSGLPSRDDCAKIERKEFYFECCTLCTFV